MAVFGSHGPGRSMAHAILAIATVVTIAGSVSGNGVPYRPPPGVFFQYAILVTVLINIPINFMILVGPLLALYGREVRSNYDGFDDFVRKNTWNALGISFLGALIDFYVVFREDVQADYHWTYSPDLVRWGVGAFLIFLTFLVPVYIQMRRSYRPAIIVGNTAVIWNLVAWSLVPHMATAFNDLYYAAFSLTTCCCSGVLVFILLLIVSAISTAKHVNIWWRREDLREIRRLRRRRRRVPQELKRHAVRAPRRNMNDVINMVLILSIAGLMVLPYILLFQLTERIDRILFAYIFLVFVAVLIVNEMHHIVESGLRDPRRSPVLHPEVKEALLLMLLSAALIVLTILVILVLNLLNLYMLAAILTIGLPFTIYIAHILVQDHVRGCGNSSISRDRNKGRGHG